MNKKSTIIAVVVSFLLLIVPICLFWVITILADLKTQILVPAVGIILVILIGFITFSISNKKFYKKTIIILSSLFVVSVVSVFVEHYYKYTYIPSITLYQYNSYYEYKPFKNSEKLVRLNEKCDLTFDTNKKLPVIDGATALLPIYCSFVENTYPNDINVDEYVKCNTTIHSFEDLIEGKNDIIFMAKPSQEQFDMAKEKKIELNLYPIGYEAFVFVVNNENPVSNLSLSQIKDIYIGKIKNWSEVGGKNQDIRTFQRDKNSGSQTAFLMVMGKDIELLPAETHKVAGMDGLIDVVSDYQNHSNAIGYSFRYYVQSMKNNAGIKILSLNGIEANKENIRNKTYPITDNFYAITVKGKESENTKRFIEWILSEQGQEIIEKVGYTSLK